MSEPKLSDPRLPPRFWAKVALDAATGCWLWTASGNREGYGRIKMGEKRPLVYRLAYETFIGPIPAGMEVDHLCFVPACCNPQHLEAVSPAENARRRWSNPTTRYGGARLSTHRTVERKPPGHRPSNYKLTPEAVAEIRSSPDDQPTLARRFGVSQVLISKVRLRKAWRHVP